MRHAARRHRHSGFVLSCSCYLHGCRCGFLGDATRECHCTGAEAERYLCKISGQLLDRIDLHTEVPVVPYKEMRSKDGGESSSEIRARILEARSIQQRRSFYNAHIPPHALRKLCALDEAGERTLEMRCGGWASPRGRMIAF
jgi:magnesium chelatase family protein